MTRLILVLALFAASLLTSSTTLAAPTTSQQSPGLQRRDNGPPYLSMGQWVDDHIDEIKQKLGIKKVDTPIEIFNVPAYGNFSNGQWRMRVHGAAFKPLPLEDSVVDKLGKLLMPGFPSLQWTPDIRNNVRNMTRSWLSVPQDDLQLSFEWKLDGQEVHRYRTKKTDFQGHYDEWTTVSSPILSSGIGRGPIQTLDGYTDGYISGNTTTYLVPEEGITIVSDIDDILRDALVWLPRQVLIKTVGLGYTPWMNMPEVIHEIYQSDPTIHFHYVTTTAQRGAKRYVDFVQRFFPPGSFDVNPMQRISNIIRLMETFPKRKYIFLGDTSNTSGYYVLADLFPERVQCIIVRNVTATDPLMALPFDTAGYKNLPESIYQFFRTPDDLKGIDFANGGCRNYTFPQNLTFGYEIASVHNTVGMVFEGNSPWGLVKNFFKEHF
ncbi:hypothetical protein FRB99_003497 [Tulasnella sp. 403]|nr:hypothetical protein FRB99_003497 [Tulasnella sp. 403]